MRNEKPSLTLLQSPRQRDWRDQANCAGIPAEFADELWQPARMNSACAKLAKRICGFCVVKDNCLLEAIVSGDQEGIRGGMTPAERKNYTDSRGDAS